MISASIIILGLVTLQRLGELVLANHNTQKLLARGAIEKSAEHYPLIVALHTFWLAGLWFLAWDTPFNSVWLVVFIGLQLLRVWVIATLGDRWTTRIIILPGAPRVTTGPYRLLSHPNYAVVAAEIAVLPMVFGLVGFAVVFSVLNAVILWVRISAEQVALTEADAMPGLSEDSIAR